MNHTEMPIKSFQTLYLFVILFSASPLIHTREAAVTQIENEAVRTIWYQIVKKKLMISLAQSDYHTFFHDLRVAVINAAKKANNNQLNHILKELSKNFSYLGDIWNVRCGPFSIFSYEKYLQALKSVISIHADNDEDRLANFYLKSCLVRFIDIMYDMENYYDLPNDYRALANEYRKQVNNFLTEQAATGNTYTINEEFVFMPMGLAPDEKIEAAIKAASDVSQEDPSQEARKLEYYKKAFTVLNSLREDTTHNSVYKELGEQMYTQIKHWAETSHSHYRYAWISLTLQLASQLGEEINATTLLNPFENAEIIETIFPKGENENLEQEVQRQMKRIAYLEKLLTSLRNKNFIKKQSSTVQNTLTRIEKILRKRLEDGEYARFFNLLPSASWISSRSFISTYPNQQANLIKTFKNMLSAENYDQSSSNFCRNQLRWLKMEYNLRGYPEIGYSVFLRGSKNPSFNYLIQFFWLSKALYLISKYHDLSLAPIKKEEIELLIKLLRPAVKLPTDEYPQSVIQEAIQINQYNVYDAEGTNNTFNDASIKRSLDDFKLIAEYLTQSIEGYSDEQAIVIPHLLEDDTIEAIKKLYPTFFQVIDELPEGFYLAKEDSDYVLHVWIEQTKQHWVQAIQHNQYTELVATCLASFSYIQKNLPISLHRTTYEHLLKLFYQDNNEQPLLAVQDSIQLLKAIYHMIENDNFTDGDKLNGIALKNIFVYFFSKLEQDHPNYRRYDQKADSYREDIDTFLDEQEEYFSYDIESHLLPMPRVNLEPSGSNHHTDSPIASDSQEQPMVQEQLPIKSRKPSSGLMIVLGICAVVLVGSLAALYHVSGKKIHGESELSQASSHPS
ncbi:MAG: hypothetical protein AAF770_00835 [Bacteroidota bacterium]